MDIIKELLWQYNKNRWSLLARKVQVLNIENIGKEESLLFVKLKSGKTFFGYPTTPLDNYFIKRAGPGSVEAREHFGVASDIITRYVYAQPLPTYHTTLDRHTRQIFSKHYANLIEDLDYKDKYILEEKFTPKTDWVVLDCGAYIGYASMALSEVVSRVVSFECNPENIRIIKKNIERNSIDNITLIEKAIWSTSNGLAFGTDGEPQSRSLVYGRKKVDTSTCTIDETVKYLNLSRVDFISLTVNGAEFDALNGAVNVLKTFHPVLSVTGWVKLNGAPVYRPCIELLHALSYKCELTPDKRIIAW